MNFLAIFEAIIGIGEEILPIFIHNPKSQKIEGIIVTTANAGLAAVAAATNTTAPVAPSTIPVGPSAPTHS